MISVDPGVNASGVAYWKNGELKAVYYMRPSTIWDSLIIELPQVYMGSKSKGNPNDLIRLAFEAGRISGLSVHDIETVLPRQWKGTIKKEVMLKRVVSRLTDAELLLLKGLNLPRSAEHNAVDAIGIGLWKLGRL